MQGGCAARTSEATCGLEDDEIETIVADRNHSPEQILAKLEEWLTRFEKARDWSVLTIELQLHAMRSPSFAESYAAVWMEHEQRVALMLRRMFERLGQTPPADVTPIAAGLIALTNGLVVTAECRPANLYFSHHCHVPARRPHFGSRIAAR
ncbi:TetR family transcriptional regulator C-terminal domain-containing protein [Klebsiella quasipneumoniae]|uniref:TetR family transcriptional regulator C-terminal domain-containing protein n=1 Tax=Klebsiella quasipneumoniae TaxID=1463165 RepID=UPI003890F73E